MPTGDGPDHEPPYPVVDPSLEKLRRRIAVAQGYSEIWFIFLTSISPLVGGFVALQVLTNPELARDPAWSGTAATILAALAGLIVRNRKKDKDG